MTPMRLKDGYKGPIRPAILPTRQSPPWDTHIIMIRNDSPRLDMTPYLIEVALILVLAALAWVR